MCSLQKQFYKWKWMETLKKMSKDQKEDRLEEIQISDGFVTRLDAYAVAQTQHIYKKTFQTPPNS